MARILIAEDEARIAAFVEKGLSAAGFGVTAVADGRAALDEALSGRFDLLVLDLGLPQVDGMSVLAELRGSAANDPIRVSDGRIYTETNNSGGINGGLSNGMPIVARLAFRPTPSIGREQRSINLETMENVNFRVRGRHDPCIVPRAVPVVEAAMCIGLLDAILETEGCNV